MLRKFNVVKLLVIALVAIVVAIPVRRWTLAQDGNRLNQAFSRADANGDGQLSPDEISRFAVLKNRLQGADRDDDGFVSFDEFERQIVSSLTTLKPSSGKLSVGDHLRVVKVDEMERRYLVHVPKLYNPDRPTPVVLAFHGGGGNPESMIELSGLNEKSDDAGFIVVYPYGSGQETDRGLTFNGGECCGYAKTHQIDDVGLVSALLDDLQEAANIDKNRVYATGISNGAIMSYFVASELSDRIAAIAPDGGPMMTETCQPKRPVSVIHFHGTGDELAPFHGGRGKGSPGVPAFLRPEFKSVDHSIQNWVKANGCDRKPTVETLPDKAQDGMRVTRKVWGHGKNGSEVALVEIENGGHTWPGREPISEILGRATMDISANDLMWEFFKRHPQKND